MSDKKKDKADRVYLRIDSDLKEGMQRYCAAKGITLSSLVTTYLRQVLAAEQRAQVVDADQF